MREIKFRAWDKEKKEFTLFDSFFELQKWNRTEQELENFIIMQYTGLKDKNGKPIYEEDIVEFETLAMDYKSDKEMGVIKCIDGCFTVEFFHSVYDIHSKCDRFMKYVKCFTVNKAIEVISNLYEYHNRIRGPE